MLKDKEVLEHILVKNFERIALDKESQNLIYSHCHDNYDIPRSIISDFVCFRTSISEASEFILFCIADAMITKTKSKLKLNEFFSSIEITTYSSEKFYVEKISFPIRLKMLQVQEDQWIGKTDINFLMKLRDAQLINYNINAQRTMKSIVRNGKTIYKITLNENAVESIKNNLVNSSFIPNTITLNIPQDEVSFFYYDEKTSELIINDIKHFDILDGYHRYIAAGKAKDENKDFNYNLELRIVSFSDDKSKSFIFQEDQKTKMHKIDSKSFNMNSPANIIINRLNQNSLFNLKGQISRNEGLINFGVFSDIVEYLYIKRGERYENENKMVMSVEKELRENFNALTEYNDKYLTEKYTTKMLLIINYLFFINKNENKLKVCEDIDNMMNSLSLLDDSKFKSNSASRAAFREIDRLNKEVNGYV